jgi:hypothetical protein
MSATPETVLDETRTHDVTVYLLVDHDGNAVCAMDPDLLAERYDEEVGNDSGTARRCLKLVVSVEVPSETTLAGRAPAVGAASLSVE